MTDIQWVDEVPGGEKGQKHGWASEARRMLRERPGQWALVKTQEDGQSVSSARNGRMSLAMRHPDFEAVSRLVDGKVHIYARYVGEGNR